VAEDIRNGNTSPSAVDTIREALIVECRTEEQNCLFTSTSFFIWLRWLKTIRALFWAVGSIGSVLAASQIVKGSPDQYKVLIAGAALAGVVFPALIRTLRLDTAIRDYTSNAAKFKNLQVDFRRLSQIWSNKELREFEREARNAFVALAAVRQASLTPPEVCFRLARWKIKRGHYSPDE
jgi:hypothetical protein